MFESLDFLDAARKSIWNAGRGLSSMLQGEAPDWNDIMPAVGGLTMGAGALAGGMGIPLSILMGSIVGGMGQETIGNKAMDPEELLGRAGLDQGSVANKIASVGLNAATDPLSFAGFGQLAKVGGLRNAERAAATDARIGRTMGADTGFQQGNRLGQEAAKARSYAPDLSQRLSTQVERGPLAGGLSGAPQYVDPYIAEQKQMLALSDVLKGMVPMGEDMGSLAEKLGPRVDQVMQAGGRRRFVDDLKLNPPDVAFPPKINSKVSGLPSVEGIHVSQQQVPLDPVALVDYLKTRPEVLDMMAQKAKAAEGALTYRPVRYPGQPGLNPVKLERSVPGAGGIGEESIYGQHHLGLNDEILPSYGTMQSSPMFEPRHEGVAEMIAQILAQAH